MACSKPITINRNGSLIHTRCKQCLPCRIQTQSSLTLQCLLENHVASSGLFLTLTYREEPGTGSYHDFSLFMKRLRSLNRREGNLLPIRFLGCGEYGENFGRFHYHALIFNSLTFSQEVWGTRLWPHGFLRIGEVTPSSARYTVRYTIKGNKRGGDFVAGKSERPPLGTSLMTSLGASAKYYGHRFEEAPTTISWDGRTWPLNNALKIAWMQGFDPAQILTNAAGTKVLARSLAEAAQRRRETLVFGDPLQALRDQADRKAFSKERISRGKL